MIEFDIKKAKYVIPVSQKASPRGYKTASAMNTLDAELLQRVHGPSLRCNAAAQQHRNLRSEMW
jgi:hypothetical protein